MKTIGVIWLTSHSMNLLALETRDVGPISLYFMDNVRDLQESFGLYLIFCIKCYLKNTSII